MTRQQVCFIVLMPATCLSSAQARRCACQAPNLCAPGQDSGGHAGRAAVAHTRCAVCLAASLLAVGKWLHLHLCCQCVNTSAGVDCCRSPWHSCTAAGTPAQQALQHCAVAPACPCSSRDRLTQQLTVCTAVQGCHACTQAPCSTSQPHNKCTAKECSQAPNKPSPALPPSALRCHPPVLPHEQPLLSSSNSSSLLSRAHLLSAQACRVSCKAEARLSAPHSHKQPSQAAVILFCAPRCPVCSAVALAHGPLMMILLSCRPLRAVALCGPVLVQRAAQQSQPFCLHQLRLVRCPSCVMPLILSAKQRSGLGTALCVILRA